jgi:hypothetical protein
MAKAKRRLASGTDRDPLIVDWRLEQSRQGPYVFVIPVPSLSRRPETDEEAFELARRIHEATLRQNALMRAMSAIHQPAVSSRGRLDAARTAREQFLGRLQELVDNDKKRARNPTGHPEGGTPVVLSPMSELAMDPLRRLLLAAAGRHADPGRRTGAVTVSEMEWPAFDDLPPEIWLALDLVAEMFFSAGNFVQAELQAREIMAGVRTKEGGHEGGLARAGEQRADYEKRLKELEPIARGMRGKGPELSRNSLAKLIVARCGRRFGSQRTVRRMLADLGL